MNQRTLSRCTLIVLTILLALQHASFAVLAQTAAPPTQITPDLTPFPLIVHLEQVDFPVSGTMLDADFISPDSGWAVGVDGIVRWDGQQWTLYHDPAHFTPAAVQMLAEDDGWIAGTSGSILHWDGNQWSEVIAPTDYALFDVSFVSPTVGWAVGGNIEVADPRDPSTMSANKIALQWDGGEWTTVPVPGNFPLNWELLSIGMVSENDGWAAGHGEIFRWNGIEWKTFELPDSDFEFIHFEDIHVVNPNDVWFVGWISKISGRILHWDGNELTEVFKATKELYTIDMVSSDFGWAAGGNNFTNEGGNLVLFWNGAEWTKVVSPSAYPIQAIRAVDRNNGWLFAGGYNPNAGYEGEVFRFVVNPTPTATSTPTETPLPTDTMIPQPVSQTPTMVPVAAVTPISPTVEPAARPPSSIALLFSMIGLIVIAGSIAIFIVRKR